ncbi:hypothetical protein [Streptomyces hirsutus]|uniref:hypothetical protein n=1 Tax=Streptomyces hirsutus TaxID=35620 RepID=UPI0036574BB1
MANFQYGFNDFNVDFRAQQNVTFTQGWDVHRLALTFEVTARGDYAVDAPFLVSGSLWTHEMPSPASWIGVLHAPSGPVGLKAFMQTLTLETTVTDQQLRGLEKLRAGADLSLRAQLTLTALEYASTGPSPRTRRSSAFRMRRGATPSSSSMPAPSSTSSSRSPPWRPGPPAHDGSAKRRPRSATDGTSTPSPSPERPSIPYARPATPGRCTTRRHRRKPGNGTRNSAGRCSPRAPTPWTATATNMEGTAQGTVSLPVSPVRSLFDLIAAADSATHDAEDEDDTPEE